MIRSILSLAALATLTAPLVAGELVPSQIPASAKWVFHADLDAIRASATGQAILQFVKGEHGDKLRAAQRMFAFHPVDDIRGVTLHGDGRKDHGVVLVDGAFDRAHLEDIVRGADGYASSTHAGHTIHTWTDKGTVQHAAFATDSLLAVSRQKDLLQRALEVIEDKSPATDNALFTEVPADGALVAAAAQVSAVELPADAAKILGKVANFRVVAAERGNRFILGLDVKTREAAEADRLRRFVDGLTAFAQLDNEKIAALNLDASFESDPEAKSVSASISLPVVEWLNFLHDAVKGR